MSFNISYTYKAIDQFSNVAATVNASVQKITNSVEKSTIKMKSFAESMTLVGARVNKLGKTMKSSGQSMSIYMTLPIVGVGLAALKASAQIEQMQLSLNAVMGSKDKGIAMMSDLKKLTLETPFVLQDIAPAAKRLLVSGVNQDDVRPKIRMLGDMASGAGVKLDRMVGIYTKVRNQGKMMRVELLQMNKAGTPFLANLKAVMSAKTGKNIGNSQEDNNYITKLIKDGKVSADIFEDVIKRMTDKGGVFHDMMKTMMDSLSGVWSNVQHESFIALGSLGDDLSELLDLKPKLVAFAVWLDKISESFHTWRIAHPILAKFIVLVITITAILGPLLAIMGLFTMALGVLLSPIGLVVAALVSLTAACATFEPVMDGVNFVFAAFKLFVLECSDVVYDLIDSLDNLFPKFKMFGKLKDDFKSIGKWFGAGGESLKDMTKTLDYKSSVIMNHISPPSYDYKKPTQSMINDPFAASQSGINNYSPKQSTMNGTIMVQATPGSKVVSTSSQSNNANVSLGQNYSPWAM